MNDDNKIIRGHFGIQFVNCDIKIERDFGDKQAIILKYKKSGDVFISCKDIVQGIEAYYFAAENYRNLETFGD